MKLFPPPGKGLEPEICLRIKVHLRRCPQNDQYYHSSLCIAILQVKSTRTYGYGSQQRGITSQKLTMQTHTNKNTSENEKREAIRKWQLFVNAKNKIKFTIYYHCKKYQRCFNRKAFWMEMCTIEIVVTNRYNKIFSVTVYLVRFNTNHKCHFPIHMLTRVFKFTTYIMKKMILQLIMKTANNF